MTVPVHIRDQLANLSTSLSDKSESPAVSRVKNGIPHARRHNNEGAIFIPNIELGKLLTRNTISELIMSMTNLSAGELDHELAALVDQIDPTNPGNQNNSRKRIFAILIMMGIPSSIIHFVNAGIWDRHLPFQCRHNPSDGQLEYTKDDGSLATCPLQCFEYDHGKQHLFQAYQWEYMAPTFTFTDGKIHQYQIQHNTPLPFTEEIAVPIRGGNSQVSRVVIHQGHHDLTDGQSFAVKRLLHSTDENFNKEVEALKLVRKLSHPHLIELLATFKYRQFYYLIFRWADDDLMTFWQNNPSPNPVSSTSAWALQQCLGIAKGLQLIHNGQCSPPGRPNLKGRHGDIKPANILRYAPRAGSQDPKYGVLKIADFGLTRFHENHSYRREYINGLLATRTYRAPEGDLSGEISYLWDLWPLGCLYLEFLTWLLQGWDAVNAFSEERRLEDRSRYALFNEDKFFNLDDMKSFGACRKDSVTKRINALHSHPECTNLIHDFLDVISEDLIRIRHRRRAKCDRIVQKLEAMEKRCSENEAYYTQPQKRFTTRPTCESDKIHNHTTTVPNVGRIHNLESRHGDATGSGKGHGLDSESGAEENSLMRIKNQHRERRHLRRLLVFLGSCFHSGVTYSVDSGKR
ncbi:kinase-like protein [Xylaria acuta]|nr:kinase-like protein [Xylaria acuta]